MSFRIKTKHSLSPTTTQQSIAPPPLSQKRFIFLRSPRYRPGLPYLRGPPPWFPRGLIFFQIFFSLSLAHLSPLFLSQVYIFTSSHFLPNLMSFALFFISLRLPSSPRFSLFTSSFLRFCRSRRRSTSAYVIRMKGVSKRGGGR